MSSPNPPGTEGSDASAAGNELPADATHVLGLVEKLGDVYWVVDPQRERHVYVSAGCESLWGWSRADICAGQPHWPQLVHPDDRERVQEAFRAMSDTGEFEAEYRLRRADGGTSWVRDRAVAVRHADGTLARILGVVEDITQSRKLSQSTIERERRLNLALVASRLHVWTFNIRAHQISIAEALCALIGLTPRQCAKPGAWRRRIHPADAARVESGFRQCLRGEEDLDTEFRVRLADGSVRWLASRATLIEDDDGKHLYGVCADITVRRADEQRMRDSELQLRTISNAIPVGIARFSLDGRYRVVNRAYAQNLLSLEPEQAADKAGEDLIGASATAELAPYRARVLAGEQVQVAMAVDFKAVGVRAVDITLVPECDDQQAVTGWIELVNDLTERNRVESRLLQRDREFKTLVENAPDIIARLDSAQRYLYINRAVESAIGIKPESFAGCSGAEAGLPEPMLSACSQAAKEAFSSAQEQLAGFTLESADGTRHFSLRMVPELDRDGAVESVLMIVYDVSDRARAQTERDQSHAAERQAREHAEAAARARDQFLAIVSHELRSPLNGIQNWSNVLESQIPKDAPSVMQRALAGIRNGVDQQVRLIEDLLDATRIMSGTLSLAPRIIELRSVVDAAVSSVRASAQAKGIELVSELMLSTEQMRADPDRMQQIIWNLLSNALKFTPRDGQVTVRLDRVGNDLRLVVSDNGRGIDPEFMPHMFDWFRRDENSSQRGHDGLGLGLAMVRHLCELHGGSVSARSQGRGKGAEFEVLLPRYVEPAEAGPTASVAGDPPRSAPTLAGLRVVIIDDQQDTLEALSALLSSMEAQVKVFPSGDDAVEWLRDHEADVALCDIAMPGSDGYATLGRVRALEEEMRIAPERRLHLIALTAFAQRDDRQRALAAGFALHLAKPASADELAAAVVRTCGDRQRRVETGADATWRRT